MPTYGFTHLWAQGDAMTRFVALLLIAMSIVSWVVILLKAMEMGGIQWCAKRVQNRFWEEGGMRGGLHALGRRGTPFFDLASAGHAALASLEAGREFHQGRIALDDWLLRSLRASVDDTTRRLQRGLGLLASIGSTAPFVGLLGTVWGIYHALLALGTSGDASIGRVAGPVGEALIMTALGLCVAIPAVLGYHTLARLSRGIVAQLNRFASGLHMLLLTGCAPQAPVNVKECV